MTVVAIRLRRLGTRLAKYLPPIRQLIRSRDAEHASRLSVEGAFSVLPSVLRYRRDYFEVHQRVAPAPALPSARAWPSNAVGLAYRDKLIGPLPVAKGRGAEIGPLNLPLLSKAEADVLYVDHLDTAGIRAKYPHLTDIPEIDRPMVNNSLAETLAGDAPLDYVVASHVLEHVPNPIRWMKEVAEVLRPGGLLSIALPDRRMTFDFYRDETSASEIVAAYLRDLAVPDVRAVYDHYSQVSAVNAPGANRESIRPQVVIDANGAVRAEFITRDHMRLVDLAEAGHYLDVHCWVFTPWSFLMAMADLAAERLMPFRLRQFYPTEPAASDRSNHSFVAILEKSDEPAPALRNSYLLALG